MTLLPYLLALLLLSTPLATLATAGGGRHLTVEARDVCRTVAALRLVVVDGTCSGTATADCNVVLEKLGVVGSEFQNWWADEGICDGTKADVAAEKISDVLANMWMETAVQVKCEGVGFACGWTAMEAPAWFESVGNALDLVAAESGAKQARFCAPDMRSLIEDVVVDIETPRKEVCATGGTEDGLRTVVKSVLSKALKSVFIQATTNPCERDTVTTCPGSPEEASDQPEEDSGGVTETTEEKPSEGSYEATETTPEEIPQTNETGSEEAPEPSEPAPVETPQASEIPEAGETKYGETVDVETETSPSAPEQGEPGAGSGESVLSAVDTVDLFGNPDLRDVIIGPLDNSPATTTDEESTPRSNTPPEDITECECPSELCSEDAMCRAVPSAKCKTVPKDGDCTKCEAKFLVEEEEVNCSIDFCKPTGSVCVSKSLAKCCGVCCRCGSFSYKSRGFSTLEVGFCQRGPVCDCLGISDRGKGG